MFSFLLFFFFVLNKANLSTIKGKHLKEQRKLEELSDDIVILHVNDVHCGVNDTIGYDGFVLYRDELKKKYKNVITVDVGDHVQGGLLGAVSDGEAIIKIMNEVGFDIAILGNHEFDYGIERLKHLNENITNKYISANFCYKKNKTSIFNPYNITEIGGKKIGFIGVLTPLTFSKTYLSSVKDVNGDDLYNFLTDNNSQELYDTIQKYINTLRNDEQVDYVILLTHFGMKAEQYTSEGLLSKLSGVDAILDGHTHKIYNETSQDKDGKNIHITQTGTKLQRIGKLIIKSDGTITSENLEKVPEPSDKSTSSLIKRGTEDRWVDSNLTNFINRTFYQYYVELNKEYGNCDFDFIIMEDIYSEGVSCRYKECALGDLVADAIRDAGNGEITVLNGGAIRNNMNKGKITRAKIIEVLPWFSNIVQKKISGQCILDALEFGVSNLPQISGGFPQVSGITYKVDTSFKSNVLTDDQGLFLGVKGKRRVSDVKINGEDLDINKEYNASLLEYIASGFHVC